MKYAKKSKYKLDMRKLKPKKEEDITLDEFYKEQLRKKSRFKR